MLGVATPPDLRSSDSVYDMTGGSSPGARPIDAPPLPSLGAASSPIMAAASPFRPRLRAKPSVVLREYGNRTLPVDMAAGASDVSVEFAVAPPETGAALWVRIVAPEEDGKELFQEGTVTMLGMSRVVLLISQCCADDDDHPSERRLDMIRGLRDGLRASIRPEMVDVCSPRLREECAGLGWSPDWADGSAEELQAVVDLLVFRYTDVDARAV